MKRYDEIDKVSQSILEEGLVEALFLKCSIARHGDDDFSDVDLYAVVSPENEDLFLKNRIRHLEVYQPLIYWSEADFVGPQIVGVYGNVLHFDLYTVKVGHIPQSDHIQVLYNKMKY